MQHPTGRLPARVALVAAGPSKSEWVDLMSATMIEGPAVDEVWSVNGVGRGIRTDLTFMLDDYRMFRGHNPSMQAWFETCPHPYFTSVPRPNCPNAHAFPLADVLALPGARPYLNHTVAYAIAYAIVIGVKELLVFGADYVASTAPYDPRTQDASGAPRMMGCAAFWLGYAAARGMQVIVCPRSPLLDADVPPNRQFYGYLIKPVVEYVADSPADLKEVAG